MKHTEQINHITIQLEKIWCQHQDNRFEVTMVQRLYLRKETTNCIKHFNFHTWNIESRRSTGVIFGPLLFLIFINDIADDIQSLDRLFAGDSSLMF